MRILVCGGAGYIGSHMVKYLLEEGHQVVVYDNLQKGHKEAVDSKAIFIEGDLRDQETLRSVFDRYDIDGVIDFAADSLVGESVEKPLLYYGNNVEGTRCLLEVMKEKGLKRIVFSSTAATYGEPERVPIEEKDRKEPANPYGETKFAVEKMLHWSQQAYGIEYVILRYFNVAGAYPSGTIGEDHQPESHLIPIILQVALGKRDSIDIYGTDYNTQDGTCVRDYIHVMDLAKAHLLGLNYLEKGGKSDVFNLGNGSGFSVRQVIESAKRVTGHPIPAIEKERRAGDPGILIASAKKAQEVLGWSPDVADLDEIIGSAWAWHQSHPEGYVQVQGDVESEAYYIEEKIQVGIEQLLAYGIRHHLMQPSDTVYVRNRLLALCQLTEPLAEGKGRKIMAAIQQAEPEIPIHRILEPLLEGLVGRGLFEDSQTMRDIWDAKLMDCLMPRPSEYISRFEWIRSHYGVQMATDDFYAMSQASNYIHTDRIAKNDIWTGKTAYGELEITINLSKPEKDPKDIAKAKTMPQASYPKCLLCHTNEGYEGRINHPGRSNHRIIPVTLQGESWFMQYSPYVYYNEHCIVFKGEHSPMKIHQGTFSRLLDFVENYPHYFVGSNADLPIVGGSILSHDHFQGGHHTFAMAKAPIIKAFHTPKVPEISVGIVHWPLSVIRVSSYNKEVLVQAADHFLQLWRDYSDYEADIYAYTFEDGNRVPHNTITPIARMNEEGAYELDLVLRNNRQTPEHPDGLFHAHAHLHHIKKENIGLIEVMGLAILPARLQDELEGVVNILKSRLTLDVNHQVPITSELEKHALWIDEMLQSIRQTEHWGQENRQTGQVTVDEEQWLNDYVKQSVTEKFLEVLACGGVYKQTQSGLTQFEYFLEKAGFIANVTESEA